MLKPKIKTAYASTYHRDGSVSAWDVYTQQWTRQVAFGAAQLASLGAKERDRILRHTAAARAALAADLRDADD